MTLHEVFDKVAEALSDNTDLQAKISSYLRDSMDDDFEFTRSRYQKRSDQEGPVPNRELGPIKYIICGCTKPFHPTQVRYITDRDLEGVTDFHAEIIWNKNILNLEEDKELLLQSDYEHQIVIMLNEEA